MFKPVDNQVSLPKLEEEVLNFWQQSGSFAKSLEQRKNCEEYVFYDGQRKHRRKNEDRVEEHKE